MATATISLDMIRVATPCFASWNAMAGDEKVRFCAQCSQHVYNLSEMNNAEAQSIVHAHEGNLCVRFYRRVDGTMMTKDCPIGISKTNPRKLSLAIFSLFVVFTFLALGLFSLGQPPTEGKRRLTVERVREWLFSNEAPKCVMGK